MRKEGRCCRRRIIAKLRGDDVYLGRVVGYVGCGADIGVEQSRIRFRLIGRSIVGGD
jgi:hypothetical protein